MNKTQAGTVYIVHAVDTEGPLYESFDEIFARVKESFNVDIKPSKEALTQLRNKEIDVGQYTDAIAQMLDPEQITFKENWHQIYEMMNTLLSEEFRNQFPDSWGNGYCFNWFCLDHVGYTSNPRRRTIGFHAIFEEYKRIIRDYDCKRDRLYFHFHPMSFSRAAHRTGNNFSFTNLHNEILARRIIDHHWFPVAYRPTSSVRMDGNMWLEQWIPFELGNSNVEDHSELKKHERVTGVYGLDCDCRGAPTDWSIYNPSVWDYRKPGDLHRYIGRCLNIKSYCLGINEEELRKAFVKAQKGEDVLVAVTNHDFRDMVLETQEFIELVKATAKQFPDVHFVWSNAVQAFRRTLGMKQESPVALNIKLEGNVLHVLSDKDVWGPQPFLAIHTKDDNYYHDNFIIDDERHWRYSFDAWTVNLDAIQRIGVATNDRFGNTVVYTYDIHQPKREWESASYNTEDW